MVLWSTAYSSIAVCLILFAHHKLDRTPLFLCSEAENVIKKKGVSCWLWCYKGGQILLDVQVPHQPWHVNKNPCCNDGKRVLWGGVKEQDAADAGPLRGGKNQGIRSPPPFIGSCRGCDGHVDSFGPPEHNDSHSCNDYSRRSPCFGWIGRGMVRRLRFMDGKIRWKFVFLGGG